MDDIALAVKSVNTVLDEQWLPHIDASMYRQQFGFPVKTFYEGLGIDFNKMSFVRLIEVYLGIFNRGLNACKLHQDAEACFLWAANSAIPTSVLSASQQHTLNANLEHYHLDGFISHCFGLDGTEADGKFDLARRLDTVLGHPGEAALMVGDTDHDIEVARICGWRVATVSHGHQSRERLLQYHGAVFPSLVALFEHHFPGTDMRRFANVA
ncbi:HAD family hydrolase [Rhizobium sp. CFBP 8762]|nr:HAD family hydrolase [Rhizobium sp. CFBP 8762]